VRKFGIATLAAAAFAIVSVPAAAQLGIGFESLDFVKAVKDRDGDKATQLLNEKPASTLVNARDGDGNTALIIAIARKDPEWTGFLLNKGADPNLGGKAGDTPLIVAARYGFGDAVEWLLSLGAKVDGTNRMGETALITAVQQRQTPVVRQLLEAGADPDKADHAAGYSARDYAQRDTRSRDILQLIQAKKPKTASAH
jgi:ankyrin repeat protein